jgi:NADPH-dependent 7-cyano-7-deazaguanine reductase QueF
VTVNTVPCDSDITVTTYGPLIHLCPFREEEDLGTIRITWTCAGATFELHSLTEYLSTWEQTRLSHEEITDRIRHDLSAHKGIQVQAVETTWHTAGLEVSCSTSPTPAVTLP